MLLGAVTQPPIQDKIDLEFIGIVTEFTIASTGIVSYFVTNSSVSKSYVLTLNQCDAGIHLLSIPTIA
jgi:hypothetical protein